MKRVPKKSKLRNTTISSWDHEKSSKKSKARNTIPS
jgi:hypothetical protein